jgi:hypothetical protein
MISPQRRKERKGKTIIHHRGTETQRIIIVGAALGANIVATRRNVFAAKAAPTN